MLLGQDVYMCPILPSSGSECPDAGTRPVLKETRSDVLRDSFTDPECSNVITHLNGMIFLPLFTHLHVIPNQ